MLGFRHERSAFGRQDDEDGNGPAPHSSADHPEADLHPNVDVISTFVPSCVGANGLDPFEGLDAILQNINPNLSSSDESGARSLAANENLAVLFDGDREVLACIIRSVAQFYTEKKFERPRRPEMTTPLNQLDPTQQHCFEMATGG